VVAGVLAALSRTAVVAAQAATVATVVTVVTVKVLAVLPAAGVEVAEETAPQILHSIWVQALAVLACSDKVLAAPAVTAALVVLVARTGNRLLSVVRVAAVVYTAVELAAEALAALSALYASFGPVRPVNSHLLIRGMCNA
jgi:hypothetical protein